MLRDGLITTASPITSATGLALVVWERGKSSPGKLRYNHSSLPTLPRSTRWMRPSTHWYWHRKLSLGLGMTDRASSRAYNYEYPFNHSTYYTRRDDDPYTSELPPMNSEEDVLQDHLMNHRQFGRSSYLWPGGKQTKKQRRRGRLTRFFEKLKRGIQRGYWGITDTLRGA